LVWVSARRTNRKEARRRTREWLGLASGRTAGDEELGTAALFLVEDGGVLEVGDEGGFTLFVEEEEVSKNEARGKRKGTTNLDVGEAHDAELVGAAHVPAGTEAGFGESEEGGRRGEVDETVCEGRVSETKGFAKEERDVQPTLHEFE
jgi:hypothetical protein